MKKAELFKMYKNHLKFMEEMTEYWNGDKARAIEQAYGYTLGITACNERYYDQITEIWEAWRAMMLYGKPAAEEAQEETQEEAAETITEETPEETPEETEETEEAQEESESQEEENKMKILVDDMKVRQMCIDENYYTRGDNTAYSHMLFEMCSEAHTVAEVKAIAEDIAAHSDLEEKINSYGVDEEQMILIITENIINECSYISLGIF